MKVEKAERKVLVWFRAPEWAARYVPVCVPIREHARVHTCVVGWGR